MNAKKKLLKFAISQDDISTGERLSPDTCMIAKTCTRMGFEPQIGETFFNLVCSKTGKEYSGQWPVWVTNLIQRFDSGLSVEPFTVEIEASENLLPPAND